MVEAGIVSTIGLKCKRCYSCVRECPAKAIRVEGGQAVVIPQRCISCGHCVKVCSQNAKQVQSDIDKVIFEILPNYKTVAMVAPSFAASFPVNYDKLTTALRKIGFCRVTETAFGADLVSQVYEKYFEKNNGNTVISSPCPAIFNFIEKYYPELVPNLAEIVSPMIAMGRYLKKNYGEETKVVFIGPCVSKKFEYTDPEVNDAVDSVLTFKELKEIFETKNIDLDSLETGNFDPPHSNLGKSFPLTGGLLKTANISSDILTREVIVVDGKEKVIQIIDDIADNKIKSKFVDILFCEGCINGPAIESDLNYYSKREKVIGYINENIHQVDKNVWKSEVYNSRDLKLDRKFTPNSQRKEMPSEESISEILARTNKYSKTDELNCGACGYESCREYAIAIAKGLAEEDMCLPYLIEKLEIAYKEIKETQNQLHNAEKLASIGQLAAGVAHEMNNPLGTIMLYASMMKKNISGKLQDPETTEDLKLILEEANRCKNIVSNLLNFARQGKLKISDVNISEMINEIFKSIRLRTEFSDYCLSCNEEVSIKTIKADKDQIKQVLVNVINNACESLEDRPLKKVDVFMKNDDKNLIIKIKDTGCGIAKENRSKLFTPFFTTKKIGKGTGLGLAITYGIVKMHKGDIKIESTLNEGTEVTIKLPIEYSNSNTYRSSKENLYGYTK